MKAKLIENCTIDSLKLRIPLTEIKILNNEILDTKTKYVISDISGEVISEDKIKSLSTEILFNQYKIKVAIVSMYDFKLKYATDYLEIYLHSKILESNYFDGITNKNIKAIYNKLMSQNIFSCSYESFVNSSVNDIDIKLDFLADNSVFKALCKELNRKGKDSTRLGYGAKLYPNGNLTFNRRESSTISRPFVKFYDKRLEALEKNNEFFTEYLNLHTDLLNKKRIEVTCKKSSDIKSFFKIENSNLDSLLKIENYELKKYITYSLNQNLKETLKIKKSTTKHKSNIDAFIHLHFTNSITNQGQNFYSVLSEVLDHFDEDKVNKARIKKRCLNWLNNANNVIDEKQVETEIINTEILKIFELIGIN